MNTNEAKIGAVAVVLGSTWATARADDFRVDIAPTQTINNVQIYTQRLQNGGLGTTPDMKALTPNYGTVTGGTTLTRYVSTSYGTSPSGTNDFADFSVVATSGTLGVIVGGSSFNSTFNYNDSFPAISQSAAYTAITAGDLTNVSKLYNQGRQYGNDVFASRDNGVQTGTLFFFDANGNQNRIGTYTVQPGSAPVPEPATLAAVGFGALAMLRRRKRS